MTATPSLFAERSAPRLRSILPAEADPSEIFTVAVAGWLADVPWRISTSIIQGYGAAWSGSDYGKRLDYGENLTKENPMRREVEQAANRR